MVDFFRLNDKGTFADNTSAPRILLQPAKLLSEPKLVLDRQILGSGILVVLPAPAPNPASIQKVIDWLLGESARQQTLPDNQRAPRITFGRFNQEPSQRIFTPRNGPAEQKRLDLESGSGEQLSYRIQIAPCQLTPTADGVEFLAAGGRYHKFNRTTSTGMDLTSAQFKTIVLRLSGPNKGAFIADGLLSPFAIDSTDKDKPVDLNTLHDFGTVCRYTKSVMTSGGPLGPQLDVEKHASVVVLGSSGNKPIAIACTLDPLNGLDHRQTFIVPKPCVGTQSLIAALPTAPGHEVELVPVTSQITELSGQPIFGITRHVNEFGEDRIPIGFDDVLALRGTFKVVPPTVNGASLDVARLGIVPGFAASETLLPLDAGQSPGDLFVSFHLGPAMDRSSEDPPQLPATSQPLRADEFNLVGLGKDNQGVTSWISVHRERTGSALTMKHVAEAPSARRLIADGSGGLSHLPFDVLTDDGKAGTKAPKGFLPFLPPRGVRSADIKSTSTFETGRLSHERRKLVSPGVVTTSLAALDAGRVTSRTPLGFKIEQSVPDGRIFSVILAETAPTESSQLKLQFRLCGSLDATVPLAPIIADALIRNRLFLVMNRMPEVTTSGAGAVLDNKISLGGWGFSAGIPDGRPQDQKPKEYRDNTLVIIKGYEGRTIRELAADEKTWSGRDDFLRSPRPGQDTLAARTQNAQKILADFFTRIDAKKDPRYKPLQDLLKDANWSGALIINCEASPADMPLQLKGLLGGTDLTKLQAEYIAIEMNRMPEDGSGQPLSRLSGIVDYTTPDDPKGTPGENDEPEEKDSYGFTVSKLLTSFRNGAVETFECTIKFLLNRLFMGSGGVSKNGAPTGNNIVTLDGRYERRRNGDRLEEIYTFETRDNYEYTAADTAIIRSAKITRVAYVTDSFDDATGAVKSRFLLDGSVAFRKLSSFDIIDFEDIDFRELGISTNFKLPKFAINGIDGLRLFFSPGRLKFNFDGKQRRGEGGTDRGFLSSFPFKLRGFTLFERGGIKLPDLGYFSFGKNIGPIQQGLRFGIDFDLDLGSLGALAPSKGFKLSLMFAFTDADAGPRWDLGFKFPEGDGTLDLGIEGILKLKADHYEIMSTTYANNNQAKVLCAIGARLEVLGYEYPDGGLNLFLFVDPTRIGKDGIGQGLGWFVARAPENGKMGAIDLKAIALGQCVDPIVSFTPRSTQDFVDRIASLAKNYFKDKGGAPSPADTLAKTITAIPNIIKFDPTRDWSIGFDAWFFDYVRIGFAMRDPDIYGLRVTVAPGEDSPEPYFAIDVLYKKLTESLGVYATEIVPPPAWRQLEFGAVSVTIPAIAFEIFTDGGFTIDLGFPYNKNYARSFGVQVFPFIGSGGLYFRRVSGPAARLLPNQVAYDDSAGNPVFDPKKARYEPVIEVGMGFRVGLGKEIAKGPFRAGLSITVFAELQGGYGVLKLDLGSSSKASSTYIAVRGTVGLLGEIYGYVDFGIVKAGVAIRIWVAYGLDFQTDHRTKLFIEAGVEVDVTIVIGRIRIFGHTIEIRISFSFHTTVEFAAYIGEDKNHGYYRFDTSHLRLAADARRRDPATVLTITRADDWTVRLAPADWRPGGQLAKLDLPVYLMPDVTIVPDGANVVPEAVILTWLMDSMPDKTAVAVDELPVLLAAWAIAHRLTIPGSQLRTTRLTVAQFDDIAQKLAGYDPARDDGPPSASVRRKAQPAFAMIETLFKDNLATRFAAWPDGAAASKGYYFPLSPTATVRRTNFTGDPDYDSVDLQTKTVVDDTYRTEIDEVFADLMINLQSAGSSPAALAADPPTAIAQAMFEDYIGLLLRTVTNRLSTLAHDKVKDTPAGREPVTVLVADLLAELKGDNGRNILATASRLFMHASRLPYPLRAAGGTVPPALARGTQTDRRHHGLYRLAWLQTPIRGASGTSRITVDPGTQSFLSGTAEVQVVASNDLALLARPSTDLPRLGGQIGYGEAIRQLPRDFLAAAPVHLGQQPTDGYLLAYPADLVRDMLDKTIAPTVWTYPKRPKRPIGNTANAYLDLTPVIAVSVRLATATQSSAGGIPQVIDDLFLIKGMSEADRMVLDRLEESTGGAIKAISIYGHGEKGLTKAPLQSKPVVVQVDLSTEPKPDDALMAPLAVRDPAGRFVASIDEPEAFVEIVRRSGITNRSGTTISWQGAFHDIKPMPAEKGAVATLELVLVVALQSTAAHLANAVLTGTNPSLDLDQVAVFRTDTTTSECIADAGTVPLTVQRPPIQQSGAAGPQSTCDKQLAERFSMLAYAVADDSGTQLLSAEHCLAVGPTRDAADPKSDTLNYTIALPAAALRSDTSPSPYARIGETLTVDVVWRDVYGNDWPGAAGPSKTVTIGYLDRLVPLNDLPGLVFAWWPAKTRATLRLAIAFDPNLPQSLIPKVEKTEQTNLSPEEVDNLLRLLDRAAALYHRAADQIADKNVDLAIDDGNVIAGGDRPDTAFLGDSKALSAADKARLAKLLVDCQDFNLSMRAALSAKDVTTVARGVVRDRLTALLAAAKNQGKTSLEFAVAVPMANNRFAEMSVVLVATRARGTFHKEQAPASVPMDIREVRVPIPLPLRNDDKTNEARKPETAVPLPADFGRTVFELRDALAIFSPDRILATGHSSIPGLAERVHWLIRSDTLPVTDKYATAERIDLALPPVSTKLINLELKQVEKLNGTKSDVKLADSDADLLASASLERIDAVLTPAYIKAIVGSPEGRDALQRLLKSKSDIAQAFSKRLKAVWKSSPAATDAIEQARNELADRFSRKLADIYAIDTVAVYRDPTPPQKINNDVKRPQAYGTVPTPGNDPRQSFSPFVLNLLADNPAEGPAQHLVVICDADPSYSEKLMTAPTSYVMSHVQRLNRPASEAMQFGAAGRYRPTAWLKLVNRPDNERKYALPTGTDIPLVRRKYPYISGVSNESCSPTWKGTGSLKLARMWESSRQFDYEGQGQDELKLTLRYNPKSHEATAAAPAPADEPEQWARAFAVFSVATDNILAAIPGDPGKAAGFFADRADDLVAALKPKQFKLLSHAVEDVDVYTIAEELKDTKRTVTISRDAGAPTLGTYELAALDPQDAVLASTTTSSMEIKGAGAVAKFQGRRLKASGLDILLYRSALTELDLTRNAKLGEADVDDAFVYRVPTKASGDILAPVVAYPSVSLSTWPVATIEAHISRFLNEVLEPPPGRAQDFDEILSKLIANVLITFEPHLVAGVSTAGDGVLVACAMKSDLSHGGVQGLAQMLTAQAKRFASEFAPPVQHKTGTKAMYVIEFRLFEQATDRPLLWLKRCELPFRLVQ